MSMRCASPLTALPAILFFALPLHAEHPVTADVVTDSYATTYGISGGAVAVVRGGDVVYQRVFGSAHIEFDVPVAADTRFQLSSSTKIFAGTLMARLAQEGLVNYETPVRDYLPQLPESWSDVTLEDIMSHTSGLPEVLACGAPEDARLAFTCVSEMDRPAARREAFSYNQTNYMLALQVIETVTGEPYADVLQQKLFDPAGMSTALLNGNSFDVVSNRATDYYPDGEGGLTIRDYAFPPYLLTAAGLNASLNDMIAFAKALYDDELVDAEWKSRMWQAPTLANGQPGNYALGWELDPMRDGQHSAGHEGGNLTTFRVYPATDLSVIWLTNGMISRYSLDEAADQLAQVFAKDVFDPVDALAYQTKLAYMDGGLEAAKQTLAGREVDITDSDKREIATWLAEELAHIGAELDAKALGTWVTAVTASAEARHAGH